MYRHPFDAISFFFGLLFTAGALSAMLVDDPWPFDRGGVWAIMLIVGGLGLLIAALRPGGDRQPVATATVAAPVNSAEFGADPSLTAAHREIDDYLGDAVPGTTVEAPISAEDTVTAEVLPDQADPIDADSDDAVAGVVTAEVVTEPVEHVDPVGEGTADETTTSPDEASGIDS